MATEACNYPPASTFDQSWFYGEKYAEDIIGDLRANCVGWTDWNLLLDMKGGPNHLGNYCEAPIRVDASTQQINVQPTFYFFGQVSKYVKVGSVRVETTEYINSQVGPLYGSLRNGYNAQVFRCGEKVGSQRWDIDSLTNQVKVSGTNFCLDDQNFGKNNKSNAQVYSCTSNSNQKWIFRNGSIVNVLNNLCLAIQTFDNNNGANAYQIECNANDPTQKWTTNGTSSIQIVSSFRAPDGSQLCLQAGRLALNSVGFVTPTGDNVLVVQNSGIDPFTFKLSPTQFSRRAAKLTIPGRSIATYVF